jgi:hypothetical protein
MPDSLRRLAPLTAFPFVVALILTFTIEGTTPDLNASGQEVLAFYQAHHSAAMASDAFGALGVVFFFGFAAALRSFLRGHEGGEGLATLAFGGAIALGIGGALFSSIDWSLADARNSLTPDAARALHVLAQDIFWPFSVGVCVFGIANGLAILATNALPRWLGWVALVLGVVGITPLSFPAFIAFMLWSLIVAVLIYRQGEPVPAAAMT